MRSSGQGRLSAATAAAAAAPPAPAPALRPDLVNHRLKSIGPGQALGPQIAGQQVMAIPAQNDLGGLDHGTSGGAKPVQTIFTNANNM